MRVHSDTAHRRLVGKSTPRSYAHPGLSIVFAPHDALPDGANDDCQIFHGSSIIILLWFALLHANDHPRSHTVRNKRAGKFPRYFMHAAPAGAVLRHNDTRIEFLQRLNRRRDYG